MRQPQQTAFPTTIQMKALLLPIVKRMPAYIKLGWVVAREPTIPWVHRAGLYATVVYMLSPAHFVMNAVPVVGQIDWMVMLLLSIRQALAHCPPTALRRIHAQLRLQPGQLNRDIQTLRRLFRQSARAAGHSVQRKLPKTTSVSKNVVFAGRVASGFTRRVAKRLRGDLRPERS